MIIMKSILDLNVLSLLWRPVVWSSGQIDISGQSEVAVFRGNAAVISEGVVKFNYNAAEARGNLWQEILQSG